MTLWTGRRISIFSEENRTFSNSCCSIQEGRRAAADSLEKAGLKKYIIILIIKRVPAAFIVKVFQTVAKIKNVLLCDFDVDLKL